MKIEVNLTPDNDPVICGEVLLNSIYPKGRWGYTTDVKDHNYPWVAPIQLEAPLLVLTLLKGCFAISEGLAGVRELYNEENCIRAWQFWEGDGTLVFKIGDNYLVNEDMKSSYGWEWNPEWVNDLPENYYSAETTDEYLEKYGW